MAKLGQKQKTRTNAEKKEILEYLKQNSYQDTSKKFDISIGTLGPWKQKYKLGIWKSEKRGRKIPNNQLTWQMKYEILSNTVKIINKPRWVKLIYIQFTKNKYPLWMLLDVLEIKRSYWDKYKTTDFTMLEKYNNLDDDTKQFLNNQKILLNNN